MITGVVKFFDPAKGYGFIKRDDGQKDVFVHIRDVKIAGLELLIENQRITFEVNDTERGPRAQKLAVQ